MAALQFLAGWILSWIPLVVGVMVSMPWIMFGFPEAALIVWLPLGNAAAIGMFILADHRALERQGSHRSDFLRWILALSIALPVTSIVFIATVNHLDAIRMGRISSH